jgi:hypothetical protein
MSNECLEGKLLLALDGRVIDSNEVRSSLLRQVWTREEKDRPLPLPKDGAFRDSVRAEAGVGIHFLKANREYVMLAYRSSEVANDRYIYSEALYQLDERTPVLVRKERFFYEVAGLESVDWRLLWPFNLVALIAIWLLAEVIRRTWHRNGAVRLVSAK